MRDAKGKATLSLLLHSITNCFRFSSSQHAVYIIHQMEVQAKVTAKLGTRQNRSPIGLAQSRIRSLYTTLLVLAALGSCSLQGAAESAAITSDSGGKSLATGDAPESLAPASLKADSFSTSRSFQKLDSGDRIRVTIKEDPEYKFEDSINSNGTVILPIIGETRLSGRSIAEAETHISARLNERYYKDATISLTLLGKGPARVFIFGAVREPGAIPLPPSGELSVVQAISLAKGMTSWADPEQAYILRTGNDGQSERIEINVKDALLRTKTTPPIKLSANDELYIQGIGSDGEDLLLRNDPIEVIVVGQVKNPGVIRFSPGESATTLRAIFKAGGLTQFARGDRVRLVRQAEDSRQVEEVDIAVIIKEGYLDRDRDLSAGDMLIVPQKRINF